MSNLFKFAENILNNLDQTAQSSIQNALNKNSPTPGSSRQLKSRSHINNRPSKAAAGDNTADAESHASTLLSSHSSASLKSAATASTAYYNQSGVASAGGGVGFNSLNNSSSNLSNSWHPKTGTGIGSKDDELMDFLNSSDFSQLSSEPALNLNSKASLEINTNNLDVSPRSATLDLSPATAAAISSQAAELVQFSIGGSSDTKSKHSETEDDDALSISELEAERKEKALLKVEIKSLNQEIQSLMKRIKSIEDGSFSFYCILGKIQAILSVITKKN